MKRKRERLDPERLDTAMKAAGFQRDAHLAAALGVAQDQIKRWRTGQSSPEGATLQHLAETLRVTTTYLFGRDEREDPSADVAAMLRQLEPGRLGEARGYVRRLLDEQAAAASKTAAPVEGDPTTDPAVRRRLEAAERKPRKPSTLAPLSEAAETAALPVPAPSPGATPRRPR